LVGGGGAAGLNVVAIARRLGCAEIIVPTLGPALSAAGALISELSRSFELVGQSTSLDFDYERVGSVLEQLEGRCREFIEGPGAGRSSCPRPERWPPTSGISTTCPPVHPSPVRRSSSRR